MSAAIADGATLLYGGERDGAQITPAVLDHVRPEMELVEETFGPYAPILRVRVSTRRSPSRTAAYGLSSGVVSNDLRAINALHPRAARAARSTSARSRATAPS